MKRFALLAAASMLTTMWAGPLLAQDAGELRIVQTFELQSVEPRTAGWRLRSAGIVESIVAANREGEIVPGLAQSWSVSADGLRWTFTLRDDAVFHDGTPVTGAAVEASYERLGPSAEIYGRIPLAEITSEGQTVTFNLTEPFGAFLAYVFDPSVPVLAPASFGADGSFAQIIGTGPYEIAQLDLPRNLLLERNADYWGKAGLFDTVRLEAATNPDTRVNIALAGEADIIQELPTASVDRINASGITQVQQVVLPRHIMLMVNAGQPQFESPELRRAMSLAIDRTGIAAAVLGDPDLAATQYVPPVVPGWHFPDFTPFAHDPQEANRILDEAGWVRGADGVRSKDGVRFAGTVRTFPQRAYLPVIAEILQDQFAQIGYELTISVGDSAEITEGQTDGTLDLGLGIRTMMYQVPDPIATLDLDFARDAVPPGAVGSTNWHNQELREAVAAYVATADAQERAPYRATIARVLHEELPVIPIAWVAENFGVSKRLKSFPIDPILQDWRLNEIELAD